MNKQKYVAKQVEAHALDLEQYAEGVWQFTFKQVSFRDWLEHFVLSDLEYTPWASELYDWGKKNDCETLYDWRKWTDLVEKGTYDDEALTGKLAENSEYTNSEKKLVKMDIETSRLMYVEVFWNLVCHYAQFQKTLANSLFERSKQQYDYTSSSLARELTREKQMQIDYSPGTYQNYIDFEASKKLQETETTK